MVIIDNVTLIADKNKELYRLPIFLIHIPLPLQITLSVWYIQDDTQTIEFSHTALL